MDAAVAEPYPGPVAVVVHDAGGAELVASYARRAGLHGVVAAAGPGVGITDAKLALWPRCSLEEAVRTSSWVLTGTSWQSDHEWTAIGLAKEAGRPVATLLDHWVNYQPRFVRGGIERRPDQVWVADSLAEDIARRELPGAAIRLAGNPYFDELREQLAGVRAARPSAEPSVLYICEPVREHAARRYGNERHLGYTEEEALEYFVRCRDRLGLGERQIVLRPHPAEQPGKYEWAVRQYAPWLAIGGKASILEEVVDADAVVGCESMAMVIGLLAGKRVISTIPPGGRACSLPHPEIEKLSEIESRW